VARPSGPKIRCSGEWTEAKFQSFIKNNLRQATRKWKPIQDAKKAAWLHRGWYLCAECKEEVPTTTVNKEKRKRENNVIVDHIDPIVPTTGWVSWDHCIDRMFCELDNLQVLCRACHKVKCAEESAERKIKRETT
jgi:hypothetical protein